MSSYRARQRRDRVDRTGQARDEGVHQLGGVAVDEADELGCARLVVVSRSGYLAVRHDAQCVRAVLGGRAPRAADGRLGMIQHVVRVLPARGPYARGHLVPKTGQGQGQGQGAL